MKILFQDIETDGLDPTKIHCICTKLRGSDEVRFFTYMDEYFDYIVGLNPDIYVFHNGLGFDVPVINKLVSPGLIPHEKVIDTMVVSKLFDYKNFNTHSLEELGKFVGVHKLEYEGDWDTCTEEMIRYCHQDVAVTEAIFELFWPIIQDPAWKQALRTEHDMAALCHTMSTNGFKFDKFNAMSTLDEIVKEMGELEDSFRTAFPPKLVEVNRIKYRYKKDGELYNTVINAMNVYPKTEREGDMLVCYDYKEFNPGSPKDRIDTLWEAGWKPFDKTDGHKKSLRSKYSEWK
jgi:DNA polymerase-1